MIKTRCPVCDGENGWHRIACDRAHAYPQTVTRAADVDRERPPDMVEDPPHYTAGSVDAIDAIEAALGPERFVGYCVGNALKYLWRYQRKGRPVEDLKKAQWFVDRAIGGID